MPVPKNKPTTVPPERSTPDPSLPVLLDPAEFRQHVRRLAVSAVQWLIEQVMCEELEPCIGASWGECTPTRRGYRKGFYTRDLVTPCAGYFLRYIAYFSRFCLRCAMYHAPV